MAFDIVSPKEAQEQGRAPRVVIEMKPRSAGPRWWLRIVTLFLFIGVAVFGFLTVKAGTTFSVVSERVTSFLGVEPSRLPLSDPREKDRIDFLLLGLRGEGDPHGGLLTDTMMVVSIHTTRDEVALISLPRDTYLTIPIVQQRAKINEAFAIGEQQQPQGGGLFLAKLAAQEVLGINIDYVAAVDFTAFKEAIDLLGGIEVDVAKPLRETQQWGGIDFSVPAGRQHMDGDTALFYVRSRFTTSDFDRARRQQEVVLAVRNKALSLGFLGNPAKIAGIFDILGRHVRTDVATEDIPQLYTIASQVGGAAPRQLVIDTGSGLLRSTTLNGSYVLLPADGTFETIRERARNIFGVSPASE
ncbi:MAG: hypothetical protein A2991_00090 [Candidatus Terrybacteria bacterium RIFCSPLOWO2_01_FULL_58_14]|uniref:Cell envelope-related transcriptional attenuator domain-containing protein n=1 Tax=Candidatus Terrybacteria bacterium RIFCSPLOWO2_01_FULL_58_14 TaxID=1802369 RepID=A0A1G2Q0M0_9BACT|nr:MAG: hypothetical protein A2991_00090 [Candidatus Terrybacteria bacterium RIFCSPLOWO2_01_FULL_58_14]